MKTARGPERITQQKRSKPLLLKLLVIVTTLAATLLVAVSSALPTWADAPHQTNNLTKTPTPTPSLPLVGIETPAPALTLVPSPSPTLLPGWLLGRIYNDLNNDGDYDDGEGIANVNVGVTDSSGATRITPTDLRGGFTLSLPPGPTLIAVNENTLPSNIMLVSGINPSVISLLSGTSFSFSLGYRTQSDPAIRITPTSAITPSATPATPTSTLTPTPTAIGNMPIPTVSNITPIELSLSSRANSTSANTSDTNVRIGDQIDYTVTVKAIANGTSEITVTVPIPDGTEYIAGSALPTDERADVRLPQSLRHSMSWRIKPMANEQTFTARFSVRVIVGTGSITARANANTTSQNINSNEVVNKSKPTAVSLAQFEAVPASNGIRITWQTSVELDTFGFALYRGREGESRPNAVLLNTDGLIAARGGTGANYQFVDETAEAGQRYSYWLHEIERSGLVNEYGPLQASTETQTTANAVAPSSVMAGGVPVPVPPGGGSQNIPIPATPAVTNNRGVQMLVTQVVVQQQVLMPTIVVPQPNDRPNDAPLPAPPPAAPAPAEPDGAATPEPIPAQAEQAATPINTQPQPIVDMTTTPAPPASNSIASIATIEVLNTPQAAQPTAQALPIPEAPRASTALRNNTTARPVEPAQRQTDWLEWIIWALIIFVVWFVVAGVLGIALGQYLRQR